MRGSPLADDAELIVSELSANAILHTASGTDDGGTGRAPKVEHQDQDAEHGRGLGMVNALAHRVVVHNSDGIPSCKNDSSVGSPLGLDNYCYQELAWPSAPQ